VINSEWAKTLGIKGQNILQHSPKLGIIETKKKKPMKKIGKECEVNRPPMKKKTHQEKGKCIHKKQGPELGKIDKTQQWNRGNPPGRRQQLRGDVKENPSKKRHRNKGWKKHQKKEGPYTKNLLT